MAPSSRLALALTAGTSALAAVNPQVKGTPQVLGLAMDPTLNRDSCGSVKMGSRSFWTCRDTQFNNADGTTQGLPVISSTGSWSNFNSSGQPDIQASIGYQNYGGLKEYGNNGQSPYFTYVAGDCSDNSAGSCSDGSRYAIWPDSPPMVSSSSANAVTAYTWIRRFHLKGLTTLASDPATTLYRINYNPAFTDANALPKVSIVDPAFWAANEIAYGDYGNVVKDGTAYLWGNPSTGNIALAKVPAGSVEDKSQYQYWLNGGWTTTQPGINDAGVKIPNVSAGGQGTYYFSDVWQSYVWIGQANESVAADFYITTAPQPQGPWEKPVKFYSGVNGNFYLGAYSLQAHPDLAKPGANEIYLTYTKNDLVNKINVYTTPLIHVQWQ